MALKTKIARKIETDTQGYVEGTIIDVIECGERTEILKGKEITYSI